ncbi:MAG: hypothetical protein IJV31_01155 [Clostridia bacterium]|nr:hypothetical protein [Clostridia bacterium]
MADVKKMYNVKNRSASIVVCRIPELGIRKEFAPGETMKMSYDELEKLSYQPGGRELMANFLQIMEDKVNDNLGVHRENEYYMNEQQIVDLLKNGSIPAFEDCLDFAPIGVIDLVKRFAIDLPLTDTLKIRILKDKTGFDVEKALVNSEEDKVAESIEKKTETEKPAQTGRRTNTNYKVVTKNS